MPIWKELIVDDGKRREISRCSFVSLINLQVFFIAVSVIASVSALKNGFLKFIKNLWKRY
jgi:hypothetical protein